MRKTQFFKNIFSHHDWFSEENVLNDGKAKNYSNSNLTK